MLSAGHSAIPQHAQTISSPNGSVGFSTMVWSTNVALFGRCLSGLAVVLNCIQLNKLYILHCEICDNARSKVFQYNMRLVITSSGA